MRGLFRTGRDPIATAASLVGPPACAGCRRRVGILCPPCRASIRLAAPTPAPAPISRVIAAWCYEGAARSLILDLKARGLRPAAVPLADAMARAVWTCGLSGAVVTWVPGHPPDERRRGFDHAHLLARQLAARLGLPVRELLYRTGDARDQVGLDAGERRRNLEGAFASRPSPESVVLVDDVFTTGATARSCAKALAGAGASSVEVVVACLA